MSLWKWWTTIAGTLLVVGGLAWVLKLWVIISTDSRVVATGAAGAFFDLGLYSLLVGSTALGLRLTINQKPLLRGAAMVGASVAFVISFFVFSAVGYTILSIGDVVLGVSPPDYLLEEAGIFISAVVWSVIGVMLINSIRRSPTEATP